MKYKKPTYELYLKIKNALLKNRMPDDRTTEDYAILISLLEVNKGKMDREDFEDAFFEFSTDIGIYEAIDRGLLKITGTRNGELVYEATDKGKEELSSMGINAARL